MRTVCCTQITVLTNNMQCKEETIHFMSNFCLTNWELGTFNGTENCYPNFSQFTKVSTITICLINAIIGICGNSLTLLAIPYAMKKKMFDFNRNRPTTDFILNLAFCDLMYCLFNYPTWCIQYLSTSWHWGKVYCIINANIRFSNAYSSYMSVALVAWSRCLVKMKAGKKTIITSRRNRLIIFVLVRIYSFVLLIPANFHVRIKKINSLKIIVSMFSNRS